MKHSARCLSRYKWASYSPLLTMPAGWDYRHGTGLPDYLKKGVGVKAPVGDDVITRVPGNQSLSLGNVVALASSKPKAQGVAQSIYTDVDFGAEPAPAAAQRLGFLAPLFWGCSGGTGVGTDDGAIEDQVLHIWVMGKMLVHPFPDAFLTPAGQPFVDSVPVATGSRCGPSRERR